MPRMTDEGMSLVKDKWRLFCFVLNRGKAFLKKSDEKMSATQYCLKRDNQLNGIIKEAGITGSRKHREILLPCHKCPPP